LLYKQLELAIEKLDWYAIRWKIELFHKILKSGYQAEDSKLRTAQRLINIIAIFCIIGWRILWLTMLDRNAEKLSLEIALTENETKILTEMIYAKEKRRRLLRLSDCLLHIGKLGGYLTRSGNPPPGNLVMLGGLSRLADMQLGSTCQ
jgi:hypothetical protein